MRIVLPFAEAIALATSASPLPSVVKSIACTDSTVQLELDLRQIEASSMAVRLALAAGGTVSVTARLDGYQAGIATFTVTAHARGLPAHKLLPYIVGPMEDALRDAGLPDGVVTVERGDPDPQVAVDVQKAVAAKVEGLTITELELTDAVVHVAAVIGDFRVL